MMNQICTLIIFFSGNDMSETAKKDLKEPGGTSSKDNEDIFMKMWFAQRQVILSN